MGETPEPPIAGSWLEFRRWLWEDPQARKHVDYLTPDRAKKLMKRGAPKGKLHRIGTWETSPARAAASARTRRHGLGRVAGSRSDSGHDHGHPRTADG